jgi:uncharacterized membrane protein
LFLLAVIWSFQAWGRRSYLLAILVATLLALDSAGSLSLIHLRPQQTDVAAIEKKLAETQGWREATLDQSHLGSAPAYFFSTDGKREQIFGWAYQGASTARTVAALNESLEMGHVAYLLDRLDLYGVDDVTLLNDQPGTTRLQSGLEELGFQKNYMGETATFYHRDGSPRACVADWPALGIGRGAQNLAYLFPQIVSGKSYLVDDYSLGELADYQTIVLSGFSWRERSAAEKLIEEAAAAGKHVLVDLTGAPIDPLARIPRFLDVWGEQVVLAYEPVTIKSNNETYQLASPGAPGELWYTHMLQGLQKEVWSFEYLGENAILAGYNTYGKGEVWFIGLNLPYHTALTHDPVGISLLADLLELPAADYEKCKSIPLVDYQAGEGGFRFNYQLKTPGQLFVPVVYLDGMQILVDAEPVKPVSYERLVAFDAPDGEHTVEIQYGRTRIYMVGWAATFTAGFGLALALLRIKFPPMFSRQNKFHARDNLPSTVPRASGFRELLRR